MQRRIEPWHVHTRHRRRRARRTTRVQRDRYVRRHVRRYELRVRAPDGDDELRASDLRLRQREPGERLQRRWRL